jgi:hypothetical protein
VGTFEFDQMDKSNNFSDSYKDSREELINSRGELNIWLLARQEEIKGMRFYLQTMEDFIEKERKREIDELEQKAKDLTEEQQSDFWSWNYPLHWEEIFESRLRSSFLISLISFLEIQLNHVCSDVAVIVRSALSISDIKGSIIERSKKFLQNFGNFNNFSSDEWKMLTDIYYIRNVVVHANGIIPNSQKTENLFKFINKQPAISESNGFVEIGRDFCFFCLDYIDAFLNSLRN